MSQTATYALDNFIADIRKVFASTPDPVARAEGVRAHMRQLLATPGSLEEQLKLPAEGGFGRYDLYVDPKYGHPAPGFLVMCSVQRPGQANIAPHDHGASWVVYGVYQGAIEQRKYRWVYTYNRKLAHEGVKSRHTYPVEAKTVYMEEPLTGRKQGRTSPEQITFSERGNLQGAQFHEVAGQVYEAARARGLGREVPTEWFLQTERN